MKILFLLPVALIAAASPFHRSTKVEQQLGEHDWVVDPVHSSVVFQVKHANASWFFGTFDKIEGAVTLDEAAPEKGSVTLTIPVDSVDTNDQKRDGHLKGPDFFNSAENPDITFTSTKIGKKGDKLAVTGDLSMAGHTKSITMTVDKVGEGEFYGARKGYLAMFTIKRSDFGMTYGVDKNVLGDEVSLHVGLELVKGK
ncbi:MAG: YceI family protein [Planctomycetes bacterium]|nr:YceI family protein [Planctomycetota bacterium]